MSATTQKVVSATNNKKSKQTKLVVKQTQKWSTTQKVLFGVGAGIAAFGLGAYLIAPYTECSPDLNTHRGGDRENLFRTGAGVHLQSYYWWHDQPVGIVFIAHGLHEHLGRYQYVAEYLNANGYSVVGIDHQGHGKSDGDFGYVEHFSNFVSDYIEFVEYVLSKEKRHHALPRFLIGHSMGGCIALHIAKKKPDLFNGIVLSAPAIMPNPDVATPFLRSISSSASSNLPKLPLIKLDVNALSRDPNVVQDAIDDPLYNSGGMRCRTANELLIAMDQVQQFYSQLVTPMLILHGKQDTLAEWQGSQQLYERAAAKSKKIHLYEQMYHELFNEPEKDQVLACVSRWFHEQIKANSQSIQLVLIDSDED